MIKLKIFIIECINEMRHKVTWSSYRELQSNSILVLVASFIFAVVVGLIDLGLKNVVSWFYHSL